MSKKSTNKSFYEGDEFDTGDIPGLEDEVAANYGDLPPLEENEISTLRESRLYDETLTKKVAVLTHNVINGKIVVYDPENKADVWLLPVEVVSPQRSTQEVPVSVLNSAERPYMWDNEIAALAIPIEDVRLGFYYLNLVQQDELNVRKVVADLVQRGVLPIVRK